MPGTKTAKDMLLNGMMPEAYTARDRPYLVDCQNLRPTPELLKAFIPFAPPVSDAYISGTLGETKAWPFPQFIQGKAVAFLCFADAVYEVNVSAGTATLLNPKDPATGDAAAIPSGKDWHFLDMYSTWMLFNGECVIWKTGRSSNVYLVDDVTITTGIAHKNGRAVMAGFHPADFYARADWPSYWADSIEEAPEGITLSGLESNWVRWSSIMAPDLLDLLAPDELMGSSLPIDLKWRNEAGAAPMPWAGECLGLEALGNGLVCYGTGGVSFLDPVGKRYAVRDFPTLGANNGIVLGEYPETRTHWAGSSYVQYMVDGAGDVWRLLPDLSATRLGFGHQVSALDRETLLCAYDESDDQFYISDGSDALAVIQGKLCKAPWMPTRISMAGRNRARSIFHEAEEHDAVRVETGTFTTESGLTETLNRVWVKGLTAQTTGRWTVKIKYRLRAFDNWNTTDAIELDSRGVLNCSFPVLEWRIVLESTDKTKVNLEDVHCWYGQDVGDATHKMAASPVGAATE